MPTSRLSTVLLLLVPFILFTLPAHAYIGPGAGAGTIAVVLGILASIVMAFFAILWYPVKRLVKKRKASEGNALKTSSQHTDAKGPKSPEGT